MRNEFLNEDELPIMLDIMDLARLLRVSKNTVYAYVKTNSIPYIRIGHQFRFHKTAVLQFIYAQDPQSCVHSGDSV